MSAARDWQELAAPGLELAQDGPLLAIELARPDKRNSLSLEMQQALLAAVEAAGAEDSVRAVLLTAQGEHFCSGADYLARNDGTAERPRTGSIQRRLPTQAHRLIPALLATQTPIVCAVRGWCSGIGLHLALACDFVVASRTARFWEPFAKRGFTPDSGGSWLLTRLVGVARAKQMLMLGREVGADEAAEWGMIHEAVDDAALGTQATGLARELAAAPTVAVGLMKWLVWKSAEQPLEQALANEGLALELSARSPDFKEGIAAFRQKRDPEFGGR